MISSNTKIFCCEDASLIENYSSAIADTTQTWCIHHRNEIYMQKTAKELMEMGLYYNRPARELIFLTQSEHSRLHAKNMSDERKLKFVKNFACKRHSLESRLKMSASHKGKHMPKYKWITSGGSIVIMPKGHVTRFHPDWKLIENTPVDTNA